MRISTVVDLELLRRYAELGQWATATDLYFDACLDGLSAAACEKLQQAVWARDAARVTEVVRNASGPSRLLASHGKVKPLARSTPRSSDHVQVSPATSS